MTTFATGDQPTAQEMTDATSQRIIARARRGTSSATTTTELGVLRADGIAVRAGRVYEIGGPPLAVGSSVAGDNAAARLRVSTAGAATTSSTILAMATGYAGTFASTTVSPSGKFIAAADGTLSVLLSVVRIAGTGNVSAVVGTSNPDIEFWLKDIGTDPGDSGIVL